MKRSCLSLGLSDVAALSLSPELDEAGSSTEDRSSSFSTFLAEEVIAVLVVSSSKNLVVWGVKVQGQQNSWSRLLCSTTFS